MRIFVATVDKSISFTPIYEIASLMLQSHLRGQMRWRCVSEIYELQSAGRQRRHDHRWPEERAQT
ncbi:hypothetical protein [Chelatococcus reniformis]|uniref:hypothetical protein n=1 Tax=Chelatococcus reniformis TaxID=1494448 RepID=UPI0016671853|nr:hypothetical protein [Chelatococcus reniformis]